MNLLEGHLEESVRASPIIDKAFLRFEAEQRGGKRSSEGENGEFGASCSAILSLGCAGFFINFYT